MRDAPSPVTSCSTSAAACEGISLFPSGMAGMGPPTATSLQISVQAASSLSRRPPAACLTASNER